MTGRITQMTRQGAGLKGSWSWTESNFHQDDDVDSSYTNPSFTPSYTISGFTKAQIKMGIDFNYSAFHIHVLYSAMNVDCK